MKITATGIWHSFWRGLLMISLIACSSADEVSSVQLMNATPVSVEIVTNMGTMVVDLDPAAAPQTVANFLGYVDAGYYDDLIFHRVIANFMIQGGGFDANFQRQATRPAIRNESNNGLSNVRGSIAMARTQDPHSATAQFYINLVDNPGLDATGRQAGYAVFGQLRAGLSVLDAIGSVPTGRQTTSLGTMADVPMDPVIISHIRRIHLD